MTQTPAVPVPDHEPTQADLEQTIHDTEKAARQRALEENERAQERVANLQRSITQREWLLACRALDMSRDKILADSGVRLLAMTWVHVKREHGGADWDRLLDMTDDDLLKELGFDPDLLEDALTETPKD